MNPILSPDADIDRRQGQGTPIASTWAPGPDRLIGMTQHPHRDGPGRAVLRVLADGRWPAS
ncbi:hypothetical protein OG373_01245 [Streptomyces avidinii]|uniref:hypothetical protein n=1 Tax=Streptomyces avidinii TaxID=1895 RepID=UPI003867BBD4|nr:hypothetical protein OG373_01245 [Streptomyces avidinii]